MHAVAVVQARMGSTRLPGKVMLPLAGEHVLVHDVRRLRIAERIDEVVVATSDLARDDVVARCAERAGASVFRGDESDVLGRMHGAAAAHDADIVVRATGDDPLVSPEVADALVRAVADGADYAGNTLERTFPYGLVLEAVSMRSFDRVKAASTEPHQREHVTQYYLEHPDEFDRRNLVWEDVYEGVPAPAPDEVRLTLDEPDDYELLRAVYERVEPDERGIVPVVDAVEYVVREGLADLNHHVRQKKVREDGETR